MREEEMTLKVKYDVNQIIELLYRLKRIAKLKL